jgi:peptidase M1-like protein
MGAAILFAALASIAGSPGAQDPIFTGDGAANYQQVVDYDLRVELFPDDKKIKAEGSIRWKNTTALPTTDLWWHLYLNAFRNDRTTLIRESGGGKLRKDVFQRGKWGYIEVTKLAAGGQDLLEKRTFEHPDDDNEEDRTVMRTPLARAVAPGEEIAIDVAFEAKLPKVFARSGYGGTFFMIAQWFPKLGVLEVVKSPEDSTKTAARWNCHQYHANSEFFADYGRFKVAITVPKGFEVGATGKRVSTEEAAGDRMTHVYEQDRVHDFAFTADPRFRRLERDFAPDRDVKKEEIAEVAKLLDLPESALELRKVHVTLLLQPEHAVFEDRYFRAAMSAIEWFGLWYGAYPYETLTIVDGPRLASGAMGMEYPTLITGGVRWPSSEKMAMPEGVTVHEFGHQFWYGLVGSNEFEEAWLDEGFNTYSTGKVLDRAYGPFVYAPSIFDVPLAPWFDGVRLDQTSAHRAGTLMSPTSDALVRPAWSYRSPLSYGVNSYPRTGLVLRQLERELGERTMARAMRAYHLRWRYRHPKTGDFIEAVEQVAGRPMSWFFDRAIRSPGAVDYAITELASEKTPPAAGVFEGGKIVTLDEAKAEEKKREAAGEKPDYETFVYAERIGETSYPVTLEIRFEDGSKKEEHWDGEYRWVRFRYVTKSRAEAALLHPAGLLLDLDRANDSRTIEASLHPAASWAASILDLAETALQLLGGIL